MSRPCIENVHRPGPGMRPGPCGMPLEAHCIQPWGPQHLGCPFLHHAYVASDPCVFDVSAEGCACGTTCGQSEDKHCDIVVTRDHTFMDCPRIHGHAYVGAEEPEPEPEHCKGPGCPFGCGDAERAAKNSPCCTSCRSTEEAPTVCAYERCVCHAIKTACCDVCRARLGCCVFNCACHRKRLSPEDERIIANAHAAHEKPPANVAVTPGETFNPDAPRALDEHGHFANVAAPERGAAFAEIMSGLEARQREAIAQLAASTAREAIAALQKDRDEWQRKAERWEAEAGLARAAREPMVKRERERAERAEKLRGLLVELVESARLPDGRTVWGYLESGDWTEHLSEHAASALNEAYADYIALLTKAAAKKGGGMKVYRIIEYEYPDDPAGNRWIDRTLERSINGTYLATTNVTGCAIRANRVEESEITPYLRAALDVAATHEWRFK